MKVDEPIEVNKTAYDIIMRELNGVVAGTEIDGKYYVKLWIGKYRDKLQALLDEYNQPERGMRIAVMGTGTGHSHAARAMMEGELMSKGIVVVDNISLIDDRRLESLVLGLKESIKFSPIQVFTPQVPPMNGRERRRLRRKNSR